MNATQTDTHPPRPKALPVVPDNVPVDLKACDQWVAWSYERTKDHGWTKIPLTHGGGAASSTNPDTWTNFHRVMHGYNQNALRFAGVGFVVSADDDFIGIDLDHCFDLEARKGEQWAIDIIQKMASYSEFSPSGKGVHIFVKGSLPPGVTGRKKGNLEIYFSGRYLTVTGHRLKNAPQTIEPRQAEIDWLFEKFFTEPEKPKPKNNGNGASNPSSDDELLAKAFDARNGDKLKRLFDGDISEYPSQSEADLALCSLLAFWAVDEAQLDRLFRRSGLMRSKWDEKHGATTYGERTIEKAWASSTKHFKCEGTPGTPVHHTPFDNENSELGVGVPADKDVPEQVQSADLDPPAEVAFPAHAWTGLFAQWRDMVAPKTEAPLPYLWAAFLQAVGLMIGPSAWHESPWPVYPNSYILLLGETGDSRKSTVQRFEHRLLIQLGVSVDVLFGIVSSEGIIERLSQNEGMRALGYVDEFRSLLAVGNRKGTMDILPKLQTLYDCPDEMATDRRKDPAKAIRPFFSLLAATPQDFVADLLGEIEVVGGFLNRFIIVTGEEQQPMPIVNQPTAAEWARLTEPLNRIRDAVERDPHCWEFEPEAAELWNEFYIGWKKERRKWNSKARNLTSRTSDHVRKIALVYSLLASERSIGAASLATAIMLGKWLESNTLRLFGNIGLDNFGRAESIVAEILRKSKNGFMYRRDLQRIVGKKGVNGEMFGRVLKALEANEHITTGFHITGAGQRRPTVQQIRE